MGRKIEQSAIGNRLKKARLRKNLTQQDVADHLGVARTVVTAIEANRRTVTAEEIVTLADFYGVKVSDLVREDIADTGKQVKFRVLRQFKYADKDGILEPILENLFQLAYDYYYLERLCNVGPRRIGALMACEERARFGLGNAAVPDLRNMLEENARIRIFVIDLPHAISALYVFHDHYGACVGLNENHPMERNRWNCAHEYGHYLVNRYLPDIVNAEKNDSKMERVVDEFAKNFLMPSEGINASFDLLMTQNAGKITPVELLVLAARYGVSFQAIALRLEELGRLRTGTYETLRLNKFRVQETRMRYGIHAVEDEFARYSRRYRILS